MVNGEWMNKLSFPFTIHHFITRSPVHLTPRFREQLDTRRKRPYISQHSVRPFAIPHPEQAKIIAEAGNRVSDAGSVFETNL